MNLSVQPLRGIVPPLATPLRARNELDYEGLERLVEHVIDGGVHGIFLLGTTGEAPGLSYRLRRDLIERTCRIVAGRVPVLVGITDTAFVESVDLAQHAADTGAQAVVLSAPYYFPAGQPELIEYLEHIVPEMQLPLFLYNMPSLTKVTFEPDTIRRAMDMQGVAGLKDSSCNMIYFHTVRRLTAQRADWSLLIGPEELLAEAVMLGGDGGVAGGANVAPRLYVSLYEAARDGHLDRVRELQAQVMQLTQIYRIGHHSSAIIKGIKCALNLLGICDDFMAEPFHRFRDPEREMVRKHLEALGIIGQ